VNTDDRATEQAACDALSLQATAIIGSALPDWMIKEEYADACTLWVKLGGSYSVCGPTFVYAKLMEALNFKVPDSADPSGHIMQLAAIFSQITGAGAILHKSIQAMMLLNLLSSHLESVSSIILAATKNLSDMKFDDCHGAIMAAWCNSHSVANAARFNQPGQQKPQWQCNATAGPSGPFPQKLPQKQQPQGNQLKLTTQKAPGDGEKKKHKRTCGKGKGKAAVIKEVTKLPP
jgi:hypothetical protein